MCATAKIYQIKVDSLRSLGWAPPAKRSEDKELVQSEAEDTFYWPKRRLKLLHGFQVPSLEEFHKRMVENNVTCNQEPTEVFGAKIAQYRDPDGLVFSVGEESSEGG